MAVTPFKFPQLFRKLKNDKISKRSGVRLVAIDCSNYFPLTLQDILNPDLYGSPGGTFLLITYHLLLTTYYLSLITYYLLLITYYLLLIISCMTPITAGNSIVHSL